MPPGFEVRLLFSAPQGRLVKIKRLDQATDAPRARVFLWLWVTDAMVRTLSFVNMSTSPRQQRSFEEATLWFDEAHAELQWAVGVVTPLRGDLT